jgi:diguanylate cyclase (GGDEF)-like protein
MQTLRRQDALLLGILGVALVVVFSSPIARVVEYVRDVDRESGLALPALMLLTAISLGYQVKKRREIQAQAAAAVAAKRAAEERAQELERLVSLGHALGRSLDHSSIRLAIEQHLPRIAGTDRVWVLVRQGTRWQPLAGHTRGAAEAIERENVAERLLGGTQTADGTVGLALIVGGGTLGVLGITPEGGVWPEDRRRAVEAAAALISVSLKNAQLFNEVRENSLRDPLTGCATRAHAMEVIDAELRRARRSSSSVSLIMFDLDYFKDVNDRYGHLCGDAVLASIGRRMKEVLRGSDLKCRYGGEEFLVVLPETPLQGARRVAETLRREIAERPIPWTGEALTVTASFGLTQAMPGEINIEAVVARADAALYRAKEDGRNCVRAAADTLQLVTENPTVAS